MSKSAPSNLSAFKFVTTVVEAMVKGAVPVSTSDSNVCAFNSKSPISVSAPTPSTIAFFCAAEVVKVPAETSNVFPEPTVTSVASMVPPFISKAVPSISVDPAVNLPVKLKAAMFANVAVPVVLIAPAPTSIEVNPEVIEPAFNGPTVTISVPPAIGE